MRTGGHTSYQNNLTSSHDFSDLSLPGIPDSGPVLLVVDDDPMLLQLYRLTFQRFGFKVFAANSGKEAIRLYRKLGHQIQLVLLDVCMPEKDGPSTLRSLQKLNPSILACFITGSSPFYSPQELLDCGAVRLFPKPYPTDDLTQEINDIISSRYANVC